LYTQCAAIFAHVVMSSTYKFLLLIVCAVSALSILAKASAQTTVTYHDGDLFLGFRATGGTGATQDYLVNIGQPAQFVNAMPGSSFPVSTGNLGSDLAVVFGSDWYTRIDAGTGRNAVLWSIVGGRLVTGGGDTANVLYATNPNATPWPRLSNSAQAGTTSLTDALGTTYDGNSSTVNNNNAIVQSASSSNSYASFQPGGANSGGISFQQWNPTIEGIPNATLTFCRIVPGSGNSTILGTFTLSNAGVITFTAATSVPTPTSVVSRKVHGAAGPFDINLPLSAPFGVECRSGGGTNVYQIVVTFASAVTASGASVTAGTGTVTMASGNGTNTITIDLSGVTNAQTITVTLTNVSAGSGSGNIAIHMGMLIGDASGSGTVNSTDVSQTKLRSGQAATAANFRSDVNASGTINATDVSTVKLRSGTSLP
jgi:hypothetical protein